MTGRETMNATKATRQVAHIANGDPKAMAKPRKRLITMPPKRSIECRDDHTIAWQGHRRIHHLVQIASFRVRLLLPLCPVAQCPPARSHQGCPSDRTNAAGTDSYSDGSVDKNETQGCSLWERGGLDSRTESATKLADDDPYREVVGTTRRISPCLRSIANRDKRADRSAAFTVCRH